MKARLAICLLGAWLLGTLFMFAVATFNFRTVDALLGTMAPVEFAAQVQALGPAAARQMLRYLSSELNRLYFGLWNVVQLVLGASVLALLWRQQPARRPRLYVLLMLGAVVLMALWLTPSIRDLGRSLDFVPRNPPPPELQHFWILHALYTVLDLGKLGLGIAAVIQLIRRSSATETAV
jgi:hypothetical protein